MAVLARYVALLCILKVVSSHPSGFWPEYIDDDTSDTNLVDSTFPVDPTSTSAYWLDTARDDDLASTVDENDEEETADEAITTATADTTLAGGDSSSTSTSGADSIGSTTVVADTTTEPQSSTMPPPSEQPPSDKPKKSWAEIFCDKVKQFLSFMGHKIADTATFIQRLFHWLY